MTSFSSRLKAFDVYRDIPKDLTEQTTTGAIISLICGLFISYLFFTEFTAYLTVETTSEMYVYSSGNHETNNHEMFQINLNITVPRIPCAVVSVDAQDIMGSHVVDVGGKLIKTRTDSDGNIKFDASGKPMDAEGIPPKDQMGEGCNIHGNMFVKMVPGNFHISAHAHAELLNFFFPGSTLNCTHYVHNLWFGTSEELNNIEKAEVAPLNGGRKIALMEPEDGGMFRSYEYYIKVVPTQYIKLNGQMYDGFQFVANSNHIIGRFQLPAIYFRYDTSPITVKFTEKSKTLAHFLVQVCAIVGGVFTVLGLVNAVAVNTVKKFKADIGKLG